MANLRAIRYRALWVVILLVGVFYAGELMGFMSEPATPHGYAVVNEERTSTVSLVRL